MRVPIFPLGTVLFPDGVLPLRVFEARYMDMTRDCMKRGTPFGVCTIREGREVGAPAVPEQVGCLAHITDWDMKQLGVLNLRTRGGERFRILSHEAASNGLITADVELLPPQPATPLDPKFEACRKLLERLIGDHGNEVFAEPHELDNAAWVGNRLSEVLPLPAPIRQELMELDDSDQRLSFILRLLADDPASGGDTPAGAAS